jgi:hypothetical protein
MDFVDLFTPPAPEIKYFTNMAEFFINLNELKRCDKFDQFDALNIKQEEFIYDQQTQEKEKINENVWDLTVYGDWPSYENDKYHFKFPMYTHFQVFSFYLLYKEDLGFEHDEGTMSFKSKTTKIEINNFAPFIQDFILDKFMDSFLNDMFFNMTTSTIYFYFGNNITISEDYSPHNFYYTFRKTGNFANQLIDFNEITGRYKYGPAQQSVLNLFNYIVTHPMFNTIFNIQIPDGPAANFSNILRFQLLYNYKKVDLVFKGDLRALYEKYA